MMPRGRLSRRGGDRAFDFDPFYKRRLLLWGGKVRDRTTRIKGAPRLTEFNLAPQRRRLLRNGTKLEDLPPKLSVSMSDVRERHSNLGKGKA
jgi:hypothetical protein